MPKLELLRKISFFSLFRDDAMLESFVREGHWAKHGSGGVVYRVGDPAHKVFVIASGKIRITRNNKNLTALGVGDVFGEVGPLLGIERTVNAVSVGDSVLFEFNKAQLDNAPIEVRYELMKYLYVVSTKRFVETTRKLSV